MRCNEDPILLEFFREEIQNIFYQNFALLGAIFDKKAVPTIETHELIKEDFINILQESEIVIKDFGQVKKQAGPNFNENTVLVAVSNVSSFEPSKLGYVDFLECLIRLVPIYPFSEEEEQQMPSFDQKLSFLIGKLDQKYIGSDKAFVDQMIEKSKQMNY